MGVSEITDGLCLCVSTGGADKRDQERAARDGCLRGLHHPGTGNRTGTLHYIPELISHSCWLAVLVYIFSCS